MSKNKEIFSRNLQYYMNRDGKSRNDVCAALGFRYSTFTDWINGNKYPRIDKIEMLANYFGIEKSDLIEDKSALIKAPATRAPFPLTSHEKEVILAYRSQPEMQDAVDRLLQIPAAQAAAKNA